MDLRRVRLRQARCAAVGSLEAEMDGYFLGELRSRGRLLEGVGREWYTIQRGCGGGW